MWTGASVSRTRAAAGGVGVAGLGECRAGLMGAPQLGVARKRRARARDVGQSFARARSWPLPRRSVGIVTPRYLLRGFERTAEARLLPSLACKASYVVRRFDRSVIHCGQVLHGRFSTGSSVCRTCGLAWNACWNKP